MRWLGASGLLFQVRIGLQARYKGGTALTGEHRKRCSVKGSSKLGVKVCYPFQRRLMDLE